MWRKYGWKRERLSRRRAPQTQAFGRVMSDRSAACWQLLNHRPFRRRPLVCGVEGTAALFMKSWTSPRCRRWITPAMRRGYRKRTPILRGVRQATSQPRFKHSGLMISVKVSGMAVGCSISRQAPLSERLRMTHSYRPRSNEIEPPLKVRCRGAFRSFMTRVVTIPYYPSVKSIPNFPTIRPGRLGIAAINPVLAGPSPSLL
jgi:hypothetical protein